MDNSSCTWLVMAILQICFVQRHNRASTDIHGASTVFVHAPDFIQCNTKGSRNDGVGTAAHSEPDSFHTLLCIIATKTVTIFFTRIVNGK